MAFKVFARSFALIAEKNGKQELQMCGVAGDVLVVAENLRLFMPVHDIGFLANMLSPY